MWPFKQKTQPTPPPPFTRDEMVKIRALAIEENISIMEAASRFRSEMERREKMINEILAALEAGNGSLSI